MSNLKRVWARGEHGNKTSADIDEWRIGRIKQWDDINIGGTIVIQNGRDWIQLEGDAQAVDDMLRELDDDPFHDDFEVLHDESISQRRLETVLTYDEDRSPLTVDIMSHCL